MSAHRQAALDSSKSLTAWTLVHTLDTRYVWDPIKARANLRAHRVAFPEAASVFEDPFAMTRDDPDAIGELRNVTLGMSSLERVLVVVWTAREPDTIRIISAWRASARQRATYAEARD
jgi:hypothetical protein